MSLPLPEDWDGDGYEPPADCDDTDPDVHPDAVDVPYNGVDEDCYDGDLVDVDGDGWPGEEVDGEDCADANPDIHPDAEEICGDARDNDCDGNTDEGCTSKDPTNPGGLAWTCASVGAPGSARLLPARLAALARRRWVRWGATTRAGRGR